MLRNILEAKVNRMMRIIEPLNIYVAETSGWPLLIGISFLQHIIGAASSFPARYCRPWCLPCANSTHWSKLVAWPQTRMWAHFQPIRCDQKWCLSPPSHGCFLHSILFNRKPGIVIGDGYIIRWKEPESLSQYSKESCLIKKEYLHWTLYKRE